MTSLNRVAFGILTSSVIGIALWGLTRPSASRPIPRPQLNSPAEAPIAGGQPGRSESGPIHRATPSAPRAENVAILDSKLRALAAGECGGDCARQLQVLAGQLDLETIYEALRLGDAILSADQRHLWRDALLPKLGQAGGEKALLGLDYAKNVIPQQERVEAMRVVLAAWGQVGPMEVWTWLTAHRGEIENTTLEVDIPAQIAQYHPSVAKALIDTLPLGMDRDRMLAGVALGLGQSDWPEALRWIQTLPAENKDPILAGLAAQWVQHDFSGAAAYAASLPAGQARADLSIALARNGAQTKLSETLQWWQGLPEGEERDQTLVELASQWAGQSLAESVDFVTKLPAGQAQDQALLGIIGSISADRPSLVAEWLKDFPDGDLRRNGLAKLAERWAGSDPVRAAEWAVSLPAEQATPEVKSAVAQGLFAINPGVSVQWLQSIGDSGAQLDALTAILSRHDDAGRIIDTLAPALKGMLPQPLPTE